MGYTAAIAGRLKDLDEHRFESCIGHKADMADLFTVIFYVFPLLAVRLVAVFEENVKPIKYRIMRALLVCLVFAVSFVLMCLSAALGSWAFAVVCFASMAASSAYMERHKKVLLSDIDELFGRDTDFE